MLSFYYVFSLELADDFGEFNARSDSNEVKLDKVNRTSWFDVYVTNKLVSINNFSSIVCFVTNNLKVEDASAALNIPEERLDEITELCSGKLIVKFEECKLSSSTNGLFKNNEQSTNINSIKRTWLSK